MCKGDTNPDIPMDACLDVDSRIQYLPPNLQRRPINLSYSLYSKPVLRSVLLVRAIQPLFFGCSSVENLSRSEPKAHFLCAHFLCAKSKSRIIIMPTFSLALPVVPSSWPTPISIHKLPSFSSVSPSMTTPFKTIFTAPPEFLSKARFFWSG